MNRERTRILDRLQTEAEDLDISGRSPDGWAGHLQPRRRHTDHLILALKLHPPRDFTDIPEVLAEVGLFEGDVARELTRLIGIRNQLVHDPAEGDPELVEGLPDHLAGLDRFAHAVRERLEM